MIPVTSDLFKTEAGLFVQKGNFFLDPQKPVKNAIVSHAHADHFVLGHGNVYCTPATYSILKARYGKKLSGTFFTKDYEEQFEVGTTKLRFYSAGHMLGSAQLYFELNGERHLYTGDFKIQPDVTCSPYTYVEIDTLITESTFANPLINHPDDVSEIQKINQFVNQGIIIGTYVLGKAQRLNALLEKYCPEHVVMLYHSIVPFHKIYDEYGIKINNWIPYSRRILKQHQRCVYLVPPVIFKYYHNQYKVLKAFASGWDRLHKGNDFSLHISDHADWAQLLMVIERSKAKRIVTLHGDGSHLKSYSSDKSFEVIIS